MSETYSVNNTLGAALIGGLIATALFGVTCIQAFYYYQESPEDSRLLKAWVGFVMLCDIADMILIVQGLYWYMVSNFSNPNVLALVSTSLAARIVVSTVCDTAIRIFFVRRIWIMSLKSYTITLPIISLTILIFTSGVGLGVTALDAVTYKNEESQYWIARTALALMVASDFYIGVCLCLLLYRARSGMTATSSIIRNLILYSINTGLLTAVTTTVCLVSLITLPATYIWIGTHLPLSKLYCNAMLGTLNARKGLRSAIHVQQSTGEHALGGVRTGGSIASRTYPLITRGEPATFPSQSIYSRIQVAEFPDVKIRVDNKHIQIRTDVSTFTA